MTRRTSRWTRRSFEEAVGSLGFVNVNVEDEQVEVEEGHAPEGEVRHS